MVGNVGFHQVSDAVDNMAPPGAQLLGGRITSLQACRENALSRNPCLMQSDLAVRSNGVLAHPRAGSSNTVEHNEHLPPARRHFHAKARTALVPVDGVLG